MERWGRWREKKIGESRGWRRREQKVTAHSGERPHARLEVDCGARRLSVAVGEPGRGARERSSIASSASASAAATTSSASTASAAASVARFFSRGGSNTRNVESKRQKEKEKGASILFYLFDEMCVLFVRTFLLGIIGVCIKKKEEEASAEPFFMCIFFSRPRDFLPLTIFSLTIFFLGFQLFVVVAVAIKKVSRQKLLCFYLNNTRWPARPSPSSPSRFWPSLQLLVR